MFLFKLDTNPGLLGKSNVFVRSSLLSTTFYFWDCSGPVGNSAGYPSFWSDVGYLLLSLCWNSKLLLISEDYG